MTGPSAGFRARDLGVIMRKPSFAAAAAALLLAGAPAAAQDFDSLVELLLGEAESMMGERGFEPVGGPMRGSLDGGDYVDLDIEVVNGLEMALIGICDVDCSDLDLAVYDTRGEQVAKDTLEDDTPLLTFTPKGGGTYRVRVLMTGCDYDPCGYAVQGYW